MKPYDYLTPRTIPEAIEALTSYRGEARVIAGGTDLLLKMKAGRLAPKAVINIKRIPELRGLASNSHLRIGALTTLEELRRSPDVRAQLPALAHAASTMASVQVRHLATVGGNLCNAAPSADLAPILIALRAVALIVGPDGERRVPLDSFFLGPGKSVLAPNELLVAVDVPWATGPARYLKHSPRNCMDIAVVGVGIALEARDGKCEDARLVLGAVAPTPLRARWAEAELVSGPCTPDRFETVARIAAEESKPIDDVRGSAWYRRKMVEVLTRRALNELVWG